MEFQATARYIRCTPRKVRLIADVIRDMGIDEALMYLDRVTKHAALPLKRVLESALANAKQKNIDGGSLKISRLEVMGGPSMKRFHAVARGSAHAYKKKMTHIRIILSDKVLGKTDATVKQDPTSSKPIRKK